MQKRITQRVGRSQRASPAPTSSHSRVSAAASAATNCQPRSTNAAATERAPARSREAASASMDQSVWYEKHNAHYLGRSPRLCASRPVEHHICFVSPIINILLIYYSSVSKLKPFNPGGSHTLHTDRALRPSCSRYIRARGAGPPEAIGEAGGRPRNRPSHPAAQ